MKHSRDRRDDSEQLAMRSLSVPELVSAQEHLEGSLPQPNGQAMQTPVAAETHTPPYEMHRYYARRSHSVFDQIIRHYSQPGQIVLDPFCGGGVTIIEGLRLRRKVIGVDINPMAILVTRMSITPVPVPEFDNAFRQLAKMVEEVLLDMYRTPCPSCGSRRAIAEWYEWSERVECPHCKVTIILATASKTRGAREYKCPSCRKEFTRTGLRRIGEVMTRIKWRCLDCHGFGQKPPGRADVLLARRFERDFESIVRSESLWYPNEQFPDGDRWRDDGLEEKGVRTFSDLYTRRNLIALARLFSAIRRLHVPSQTDLWFLTFTSALWRSSRTAYVKSDQRLVNHGHTYWIPDVSGEINVWDYFVKRRVAAVRRGLEYIASEIDGFSVAGRSLEDLGHNATYWLMMQSADQLPIAPAKVDVIITDPPYGGNVQYAELSNLWWIWKGKGLIDNSKEAVQTRNTGFQSEKLPQHYEEMLYRVFLEAHRVLRPGGWMVLTFHNRDIGVWMTLHRAANRAGFQLPSPDEDRNRGMLYQAPIGVYTTTLHQQATGAMLGDFILSFKRRDRPVLVGDILEQLSSEEEGLLRERTQHLIEYHGGADINTLMTGLLPFLQERGLLHRLARFDFEAFFTKYFPKREGKWYTADMASGRRPLDFIPAERLVEQVVVSLLHAEKVVTLDRVLVAVYQTLVNSQRPNIEVVNRVLDRISHKVPLPGQKGRSGFALRSQAKRRAEVKLEPTGEQTGLYGEGKVLGLDRHDEIIRHLVKRAHYLGYDVHVGETEQGKSSDLAGASVPMASNVDFGIPYEAFETIKEIDLLVLNKRTIQAAFEVATTIETANKAINDRYRNLFAALNPGFQIRCYLIAKDVHYGQAARILYTPANAQEGLSDRIRIVKTSNLTTEQIDQLIDPTRALGSQPGLRK